MIHAKVCTTCEQRKTLSEFYRHPKTSDGVMATCKSCHKAAMRHNRRTNPDVQRRERERAKKPHRRSMAKRAVPRWRSDNPDRYRAQCAINNAIRDGKIKRGTRCACGSRTSIFGIATNLEQPLRGILWTCAKCHHRSRFEEAA